MGYVYIFSNPSMPGLVKVGKTTTAPSQRMQELHSTGVPTAFETELAVEVADCHASERAAHRALDAHRVSANREFFKVSPRNAIEAILPILGEYKLVEVRDPWGIEELESQLRRRAEELRRQREKQEIARIAEENERARAKAQRLAELQRQLTVARAKLSALGPRPVNRTNWLSMLLILCWMPLPFGSLVWIGALGIFAMFGRPGAYDGMQFLGVVCSTLLFFGYRAYKEDAKFSKAVEPFLSVEAEVHELETTIRREGGEVPAQPPSQKTQLPLPRAGDVKEPLSAVSSVAVKGSGSARVALPSDRLLEKPTPRGVQARGGDAYTTLSVVSDVAAKGGSARVALLTGRVLEVQIPRGVQEGARLRLRGQGHRSPNGGEPGDAIVTINIARADEGRFGRGLVELPQDQRGAGAKAQRGEDVVGAVTVPLGTAMLGGFARVLLPSGRAFDVKVPMGVTDGAQLRLRGLGAPGLNGGEPGDAVVTVNIARSDEGAQGQAQAQPSPGASDPLDRGDLPKDASEAAHLFKLAARREDAQAQFIRALFYHQGRLGLPKDECEAARLYKLAADKGHAGAQCSLGVYYANGKGGLPTDLDEAARLFRLAADQGHAEDA